LVILTALRFTKKQLLLIIDFNGSTSVFWLKKSDAHYLKEVISTFLFNEYFSVVFMLIILIVIVWIIVKKPDIVSFQLVYAISIGLGSIFILFFLGKITPIFLGRYLLFTLPFLFLIIAYGFSFIKNSNITISIMCLFFVYSTCKINFKTDKGMDYRSAVKFINTIKVDDDLIIVKTKDIKPLYCYYYDKGFFSKQKKDLPQADHIVFCNSWQDVGIDVKNFKRIIVVDSYEGYNSNEKEFVLKLSEQKHKCFTTDYFKGVKISFYK
jgi:hypothetical protein